MRRIARWYFNQPSLVKLYLPTVIVIYPVYLMAKHDIGPDWNIPTWFGLLIGAVGAPLIIICGKKFVALASSK